MSDTTAAALQAKASALGIELEADAAARLLAYLDALLALNEQINLTAIRDREQAIVLHVLDSVAFARTGLQPRHVLDLGTGNGFPGLGVAALHPRAAVVLLDRTQKKVRAIGACLLTARWSGVDTLAGDAAQVPSLQRNLRQAFDCVVARAVGKPELLAELATPLLRPGGHLVLWLDQEAEAAERLGALRRTARIGYDLPEPAARHRELAVYRFK